MSLNFELSLIFQRYFRNGYPMDYETDSQSIINKLLMASIDSILTSKGVILLEDFDKICGVTTMPPPATSFLETLSRVMKTFLPALQTQYLSRITIAFTDSVVDLKSAEAFVFMVKYNAMTNELKSPGDWTATYANNTMKKYFEKLISQSNRFLFTSCYIVLKLDFLDFYEDCCSNVSQSKYNLYYLNSKCYYSPGPDDGFRQCINLDTTCMNDSLMPLGKVVTPFHTVTAFTYNFDLMSTDMKKSKLGATLY